MAFSDITVKQERRLCEVNGKIQESEYVIRKMQANGWKPTME